jgi:hypothetical protein
MGHSGLMAGNPEVILNWCRQSKSLIRRELEADGTASARISTHKR